MSERKLSVIIDEFKPMHRNTLRGFASITVPELHLKIYDIGIHEKGESRWVGMPGKPQIDRTGTARKDDRGKVLYTPTMEFTDKATRDAFSHRVITALLEFAPAAFSTDEEEFAS